MFARVRPSGEKEREAFLINRVTSTGVSEKLAVPEHTVTQWAECLGIGDPSATGKRLFSQDEINVIETVKAMREQNHGFDTIARRLKTTALVSEAPEPLVRDLDMKAITQEVAKAVVEAVQTETQQAEKYARATYLIGQLEEQVKRLEEENRRLKAIAALPWWKALFSSRRVELVSL